MTRRHVIAVLVACAAMLAVLGPPLWVRVTGEEVTLAIRPVDPLSLFRGNYVDLMYSAPTDADPDLIAEAVSEDRAVYVVFENRRPGVLRRIELGPPKLADDEFCVKTWRENEVLVAPMLATGLFEDTGMRVPSGYVVAPVWRIKDPANVPSAPGRRAGSDRKAAVASALNLVAWS